MASSRVVHNMSERVGVLRRLCFRGWHHRPKVPSLPVPSRPSLSLSGCCKRDRRRYIKCLLPLREAKSDDWRASGPKADMGSEVIILGWELK